jgi:hypothetical protein
MGTELSPQYVERINARLGEIRIGDALDGVENPLTSVPQTANGKALGEARPKRRSFARGKRSTPAERPLLAENE